MRNITPFGIIDGMEKTAELLVAWLRERGLTCATAESCTGGWVGKAITSVPGASDVYLGGVVSYANSVKMDVLGVPHEVLERVGAVSRDCAIAMALGARSLTKADRAVSVTGIAGPGGGSELKPVGTVWFALATADGAKAEMCVFKGGRDEIRRSAVMKALELLGEEDGR